MPTKLIATSVLLDGRLALPAAACACAESEPSRRGAGPGAGLVYSGFS